MRKSLGVIILLVVVLVVLLMGLFIRWGSGMFTYYGPTYKVFDVQRDELLLDIVQLEKRVGVATHVTRWERGEWGEVAIGIRNTDTINDKTFYINMYLDGVGGELENIYPDGVPTQEFVNEVEMWFTHSISEFVPATESRISDIIIKPPRNANLGIYMFRVVVCESEPCTNLTSPSLYGSENFAIEICTDCSTLSSYMREFEWEPIALVLALIIFIALLFLIALYNTGTI